MPHGWPGVTLAPNVADLGVCRCRCRVGVGVPVGSASGSASVSVSASGSAWACPSVSAWASVSSPRIRQRRETARTCRDRRLASRKRGRFRGVSRSGAQCSQATGFASSLRSPGWVVCAGSAWFSPERDTGERATLSGTSPWERPSQGDVRCGTGRDRHTMVMVDAWGIRSRASTRGTVRLDVQSRHEAEGPARSGRADSPRGSESVHLECDERRVPGSKRPAAARPAAAWPGGCGRSRRPSSVSSATSGTRTCSNSAAAPRSGRSRWRRLAPDLSAWICPNASWSTRAR